MTKFRSAARPAGRFCLWTIAGLLALELVLRTFYISPSRRTVDPEFGPRYEAHAWLLQASEGYSKNLTNSLGLLDHELRIPRPRMRVLLLGDSFVEGKQVSLEQRMDTVAERQFSDESVEIINGGHAGWAPQDGLRFLESMADRLRPDIVVLEIGEDDILQLRAGVNSMFVRHENEWELRRKEFKEPRSAIRQMARSVARHSSLWTLVRRRTADLIRVELERLHHRDSSDAGIEQLPEFASRTAQDDLLRALFQSYEAHGYPLVILYMPKGRYFHPGPRIIRTAFLGQLEAVCVELGIPLVNPTDSLWESFDRTHRPGHGFQNSIYGTGHLNAHGHAILGHQLASTLRTIAP